LIGRQARVTRPRVTCGGVTAIHEQLQYFSNLVSDIHMLCKQARFRVFHVCVKPQSVDILAA
jgi:hypothetical protein